MGEPKKWRRFRLLVRVTDALLTVLGIVFVFIISLVEASWLFGFSVVLALAPQVVCGFRLLFAIAFEFPREVRAELRLAWQSSAMIFAGGFIIVLMRSQVESALWTGVDAINVAVVVVTLAASVQHAVKARFVLSEAIRVKLSAKKSRLLGARSAIALHRARSSRAG